MVSKIRFANNGLFYIKDTLLILNIYFYANLPTLFEVKHAFVCKSGIIPTGTATVRSLTSQTN